MFKGSAVRVVGVGIFLKVCVTCVFVCARRWLKSVDAQEGLSVAMTTSNMDKAIPTVVSTPESVG